MSTALPLYRAKNQLWLLLLLKKKKGIVIVSSTQITNVVQARNNANHFGLVETSIFHKLSSHAFFFFNLFPHTLLPGSANFEVSLKIFQVLWKTNSWSLRLYIFTFIFCGSSIFFFFFLRGESLSKQEGMVTCW